MDGAVWALVCVWSIFVFDLVCCPCLFLSSMLSFLHFCSVLEVFFLQMADFNLNEMKQLFEEVLTHDAILMMSDNYQKNNKTQFIKQLSTVYILFDYMNRHICLILQNITIHNHALRRYINQVPDVDVVSVVKPSRGFEMRSALGQQDINDNYPSRNMVTCHVVLNMMI